MKMLLSVFVLTTLGAQSFQVTREQGARLLAEALANGVPDMQIDREILAKQLAWDPNTALTAEYADTEARLREEVVRLRLRLSVGTEKVSSLSADDLKRAMQRVRTEDVLEALERRDADATNLERARQSPKTYEGGWNDGVMAMKEAILREFDKHPDIAPDAQRHQLERAWPWPSPAPSKTCTSTTMDGLSNCPLPKLTSAECLRVFPPDRSGGYCEWYGFATTKEIDEFERKRGFVRVIHKDGTGDTWERRARLTWFIGK